MVKRSSMFLKRSNYVKWKRAKEQIQKKTQQLAKAKRDATKFKTKHLKDLRRRK